MWSEIISSFLDIFQSVFGWLETLLNAVSGSWHTIISLFTMLNITRFIMGAVVGTVFGAGVFRVLGNRGSDRAQRSKED